MSVCVGVVSPHVSSFLQALARETDTVVTYLHHKVTVLPHAWLLTLLGLRAVSCGLGGLFALCWESKSQDALQEPSLVGQCPHLVISLPGFKCHLRAVILSGFLHQQNGNRNNQLRSTCTLK